MTPFLMPPDDFWRIISVIGEPELGPDDQVDALRSALIELSADEIVLFEGAFRYYLNQAYTWDLWGAACVIHGGCSDDGFEYFRRWLVSRGRDIYEGALRDPESLAEVHGNFGPDQTWEFEEIYYVAVDVFEEKGGEGDPRDYSEPEAGLDGRKPSGEPFLEDKAHLALRYPKLWQRFGLSPLG